VFEVPYQDFAKALLVFARMTAMVAVMPIFGFNTVPTQLKGAISIIFTIIVFPIVTLKAQPISTEVLELLLMFSKEVIVGLIIGFIASILFYSIQMAGHLVGIQMGFGIINVIDPMNDMQISLIGQIYYLTALLVFLSIDGHHFLVRAIVLSYDYIGVGGAVFPAGLMAKVNLIISSVYEIALRISAPMFVTLFITDIVLGIMARVAPQMNVFVVGFPLKIAIGLLVITLVISLFPYVFGKLYEQFQIDIIQIIKLMGR
jgi:flagellar biosynthesis protein FliR